MKYITVDHDLFLNGLAKHRQAAFDESVPMYRLKQMASTIQTTFAGNDWNLRSTY